MMRFDAAGKNHHHRLSRSGRWWKRLSARGEQGFDAASNANAPNREVCRMIIRPDFPTHWKTRMLVEVTGNPDAGMIMIRLWSHCQHCRTEKLHISDAALASICGWKGDGCELRKMLITCGFVEPSENGTCIIHDWKIQNKMLLNSWKNGSKGGRPRSYKVKPTGNPRVTHGEPTPLLSSNHSVPVQDTDWVRDLSQDPAYKGINVRHEYDKAVRWCKENPGRQATRRFFIRWLNKADRNLQPTLFQGGPIVPKEKREIREPTDEEREHQRKIIAHAKAKLQAQLHPQ